MKLQYKKNKKVVIFIGLAILIMVFFAVRGISIQLLLMNKHSIGEDKLLTYVADLRREIADYRFLPYTLTNHPKIRAYLKSPTDHAFNKLDLQRQIEDLSKASNTHSWFLLNAKGQRILSSLYSANDNIEDYFTNEYIVEQLEQQRGESILLSGYHQSNHKVAHIVLAPIYENDKIAGSIGVRFGLDSLLDSWSIVGDLMSITDNSNQIFLASGLHDNVQLELNQEAIPAKLLDNTSVSFIQNKEQTYLLQSVILDDLKWQIQYFSPLNSSYRLANFIGLGGLIVAALVLTFYLYRRERSLKIASKIENQRLIDQSAQLQRALIEGTHVGLMQLNQQGTIVFINPTGLRYLHFPEDIIGVSLMTLLRKNSNPASIMTQLDDVFFHGVQHRFTEQEVIIHRPDDSSFPAMLSISSIKSSDSNGFLATLIDISKRKKAEQELTLINHDLEERVIKRTKELEKAQKELLRSEKLAAIGQMSTAIAHELNQPLTGMRTLVFSTDLLLQRNKIDDAHKSLNQLEMLITRMHTLTSELKVLAYKRPEQLVPVNCQTCFDNAMISLGGMSSKAHIDTHFINIRVLAEPIRLERIFVNLISNSIEACIEHNITPRLKIMSYLDIQTEHIILEFCDNGPGVNEEALPHLLEPFYTSKPIGKGLGLGLAISANLANDMNGKLRVFQGELEGLIFHLTLEREPTN